MESKFLNSVFPFIRGLFRSETIRFNGVLLAVWTWAVETGLVGQLLEANPNVMTVLVYVSVIVNALLRVKTTSPLIER